MNEVGTCYECGAPILADSPPGLCAKCLLGLGLCRSEIPVGANATPEKTLTTSADNNAKTLILGSRLTEKPGDCIGHYKLLHQIGEGGCGIVYMAEQQQPIRRHVALKVIKLGMDTKQIIARFEAERQALALMDHPNIAKVLDAGATDAGRPYFLMELVRGTKITDHCDTNKLSTDERLKLFALICRAIQHAHQKGIIHRDIKPSNILITLNDGVPVPKVIDFGIAKAIAGPLTDRTIFTAFEQFIGTPAYMSPEQAEMTSLDIDTRSDIYSLGVLLYELLTGKTPFDARELLAAGVDAIRRTIREKEPARPSTRLSTMVKGELTTVAKHRQTDPPKLIHLIRGDLDRIIMKCLEKDRARRYETAFALAGDVECHLTGRPISAVAPTLTYRLSKFVRRHKKSMIKFSAFFVLGYLILSPVVWILADAIRNRDTKGLLVSADFQNILGLYAGAPVVFEDKVIGKVVLTEFNMMVSPGRVRVRMKIQDRYSGLVRTDSTVMVKFNEKRHRFLVIITHGSGPNAPAAVNGQVLAAE
jgi:serine/threonine protein kinase